jgi:hypothetical protein
LPSVLANTILMKPFSTCSLVMITNIDVSSSDDRSFFSQP